LTTMAPASLVCRRASNAIIDAFGRERLRGLGARARIWQNLGDLCRGTQMLRFTGKLLRQFLAGCAQDAELACQLGIFRLAGGGISATGHDLAPSLPGRRMNIS